MDILLPVLLIIGIAIPVAMAAYWYGHKHGLEQQLRCYLEFKDGDRVNLLRLPKFKELCLRRAKHGESIVDLLNQALGALELMDRYRGFDSVPIYIKDNEVVASVPQWVSKELAARAALKNKPVNMDNVVKFTGKGKCD